MIRKLLKVAFSVVNIKPQKFNLILVWVNGLKRYSRGNKETHMTPELQVADPWTSPTMGLIIIILTDKKMLNTQTKWLKENTTAHIEMSHDCTAMIGITGTQLVPVTGPTLTSGLNTIII